MSDRRNHLRNIPAVDKILQLPPVQKAANDCPHILVVEAVQQAVEELRRQILDEKQTLPECKPDTVAARALELLARLQSPSLKKVINVTGTLLHTNLGRAPLCPQALTAIEEVSRGYSNLEFDLESGERGKRFRHVEDLLCRLTGAEAATVVNNNAGAVLLALTALAKGKSALVSRGELIEIGGSFRIPDIMAAGDVELTEVGTTNKTHLEDYRRAISERTALVLKVHTSNYRIVGFTEAVAGGELAALGKEHSIPVLEDLGSGLLLDLSGFGLPPEPTVRETLKTGIDVVTFSGDKLLGGPQAGLIVGSKEHLDRIRKHPMARALRIDKMTLAALEATLRLYLDPDLAFHHIPTLQMLALTGENVRGRCNRLLTSLEQITDEKASFEIVPVKTTVGGGAMPLAELSGYGIAVSPSNMSGNRLARKLRRNSVPVIGRIQEDTFIIDPRTLLDNEESLLIDALKAALD